MIEWKLRYRAEFVTAWQEWASEINRLGWAARSQKNQAKAIKIRDELRQLVESIASEIYDA